MTGGSPTGEGSVKYSWFVSDRCWLESWVGSGQDAAKCSYVGSGLVVGLLVRFGSWFC